MCEASSLFLCGDIENHAPLESLFSDAGGRCGEKNRGTSEILRYLQFDFYRNHNNSSEMIGRAYVSLFTLCLSGTRGVPFTNGQITIPNHTSFSSYPLVIGIYILSTTHIFFQDPLIEYPSDSLLSFLHFYVVCAIVFVVLHPLNLVRCPLILG